MDKKELIAHYFLKALSREEQKEFDFLMSTDSEFAKEVTFQQNLKTVIEKEEHDTLKQQLHEFEAEKHTNFYYTKWLVAATVVILLGISSFWYFNAIDTEKLYAENFKPYRNVVQPIVRGESKTDLKTKAFTAYETKKYTEALNYFDIMLKENPNETIAFYKANVLLKLNKTEEAISILKANLKTSDSLDAKNTWYLALAELRLNNTKNAKDQLTQLISSEDTFKKSEAKKLLKILK